MGKFVMINEKTRDELNPYDLSRAEKERAKKEGIIYICKCCYPKKSLRYHFTDTLQLRAIHNEYTKMHDESCKKNEVYQKRIAYANPLQQDEDGNLVAKVHEKIFDRPIRNIVEGGDEHTKRRDINHTQQQKMRLAALIKKLNLEVSAKQAGRYELREGDTDERKIQFKMEKDFSKEVYGNANNVRIFNCNRTMAGCSLDREGVSFFYNKIGRVKIRKYILNEPKEIFYTSISCDELIAEQKKHGKNLYCFLEYDNKSIQITYDALRVALRQYENTYNGRVLNLEDDIVIGAGYQYKTGRTYIDKNKITRMCGEIDRCTFMLVNKYGIFCESSYEVMCFDTIMDYIMDNKLYKEVKFYKPYSFTKNAYGDAEWLEDGVITIKGYKKVGIVEVFGMMGNEEYREKTKLKEMYAIENKEKFAFLTWYPEKESLEILVNKLVKCIEEIRASVHI